MLLLTGGTGLVGSVLLRRLTARREAVRCLVRDPRRLGAERVRVQIALGDLGEPSSFRHALRGVSTVVHLAAAHRDQPHATIEEVTGLATWRLLRAAERAGVEHFVFLSPLGATPYGRSRVHRAKALAAAAVADADLPTTTLRTSLAYAPHDRRLALLHRVALLPAVPVPGLGRARSQPIWADDLAECLLAVLGRGGDGHTVLDLAGPETLRHREILELALRRAGRGRPVLPLPGGVVERALRAYEALTGPAAFATWDEVEFLGVSMLAPAGTRDAEALGVRPRKISDVLAAAA